MILRRYGNNIHSVTPNFDSRAMTEIGFMRSGEWTIPANEFAEQYERVEGRELTASAAGEVQGVVEDTLLADLRKELQSLEDGAGRNSVLMIENEQGKDLAKTRGVQTTKVVQGTNRLHFQYTVDPPLKVGIYQRKSG
jgi:hypothetical protein